MLGMYFILLNILVEILLTEATELDKCAAKVFSRFDCEYKIVEKLVDLETDGTLLREQYTILENKNAELMSMVEEQRKEIENLKQKGDSKAVFANVYLPGIKTFSTNQRLIYRNVIANVGNAYNTQHGYFEAPREGTYLFTAEICTGANTHMEIQLKQDGRVLNEVASGDPLWHVCGSCTAVTHMTVGSKVWVHISYAYPTGKAVLKDQYGRSSFSGVLLNTNSKS